MPTREQSRLAFRAGIVVVLLVALGGVWRWRHRATHPSASSTQTRSQPAPAASRASAPHDAPVEPARLTIAVSDDKGPLAGASIRLAPRDGDVVVIATGGDGVARAEHLEPGSWRISASAPGHVPAALPTRVLAAGADDKLAIKLVTGGASLSGTVSDVTGGPIAGARIDAARLTSLGEPGDAVSTAVSGADGKYRMTVADGATLVAAASPDYAPQSRRVEIGAAGAVADFALVPGGVIEGIVRDERTRQPVGGASVVARRGSAMLLAETSARRVSSGSDGRFRLGGLRPGVWELEANAQTRFTKRATIVGLGVAEQVGDVELLIGDGPVIRGRVLDETGAPAPGVTIRASSRGEGLEETADATGAFTLEALRPGNYVLTARSETFIPAGPTRVALADKDLDGIVVRVKRGAMLTGHVEPRQVCDVSPEGDEIGPLFNVPPSVTTGPDGAFTLGPLREIALRLTARCPSGDAGAMPVKVTLGLPEVVIKVTPGASIAGRVFDAAGKPVAGIGVMASEVSQGERTMIRNGAITSGVHTLTDAAGAYKLAGLTPGTYQMGALDRGRPLRTRDAPSVELAAAEHKTGVNLAIDRPAGVIAGTVTGPDGKPLADAWVSAQQDLMAMFGGDQPRRSEARTVLVDAREGPGGDTALPPVLTDAQGHYAIRGLPAATYTVVAEAQRGQLRARTGNVTPDATVDLRVALVTALAGTVAGANGPAALFSVELDGPTRAQRSFSDGKFAFERVDPGTYTVRVQSSEGNGEAKVEVTPDAPASVAITLAANAVVIGKLVDPSGKPIAGQVVVLTPDRGDGRLMVSIEGPPPTTGPDGSFRIEHRAEPCVLMVMRQPRPFSRRGLVLTPGQILDLGTVTVDSPADAGHGSGSGSAPPPPAPPSPRQTRSAEVPVLPPQPPA